MMMQASRRREEDEEEERIKRHKKKREQKMLANGYVKQYTLLNPNSCYIHKYRNEKSEKDGMKLILYSSVILFSIMAYLSFFSFVFWLLIPVFVCSIFVFIGFTKFYNTHRKSSGKSTPEELEGFRWLDLEYNSIYGKEWVKKQ